MKLNLESTRNHAAAPAGNATTGTPATDPAGAAVPANGTPRFRRLEWNELVTRGDFVADGHQGFELWEGPGGFRADAFVKPIYRQHKSSPAKARKSP